MRPREMVESMYDSMTPLVRPGNWDYATEELADNTTFAEGVVDEKVDSFTVAFSQTPMTFTVYRGQEGSDYDYYLSMNDLPGSWQAYGYDQPDHEAVMEGFRQCPAMIQP